MPTVSVILPTCDRPQLWPRALASVLRQTFADYEVLLVDSNRDTPAVREHPDFARFVADPRVRLIEGARPASASAARNLGLAAARGEWVTYLDDDDHYRPEKIARQLALARQTGAALVLCGYTVVLPWRRRRRQDGRDGYEGDARLTDATWCTPLLFHARVGDIRFDEGLRAGEDEVFAQAFLAAQAVSVVPNCRQSLVEMYPQLGRPRVNRNAEENWRAARVIWKKYGPLYSPEARRRYVATKRLARAQGGVGSAAHFVRCAWAVFATSGVASWRRVANATASRAGVLEKWIVS